MSIPRNVAALIITISAVLLPVLGSCTEQPGTHEADAPDAVASVDLADAAPDMPNEPPASPTAEVTEWQFDGFTELLEVPEPSGMCYHPGRDTLFVVDDGDFDRPAAVYELDLHAEVLQKQDMGIDLEGICYCPVDDRLYIVDESEERLYVVDPQGLRQDATYTISRTLDGREVILAGGNGFEGIEYIPADRQGGGDYFYLLNQDDPYALTKVLRPDIDNAEEGSTIPIRMLHELPHINLGELHYDAANRELWVIHSWMNVMEVLDVDSLQLKRWEVIPGAAQEAVCLDGLGRLWIGYDLGGMSRYVKPGMAPASDGADEESPEPVAAK